MTSAASGATAAGAPDAAATGSADRALLRVVEVAVRHEGAEVATPASATLEVRPGELVLLLGPSGSGKSTLALTANGLIPQAVSAVLTGTVHVAGRDATTTPVPRLSAHVGMVFQDPDAQLVTGTLLDEVAFGPENLKLPVDEVLARTEQALRQVGLWERRRENPDRLSGGGKQRLAIACALALGSDLLVLDEPTANLDPAGIEDVYLALREVVTAGRAVLLVEHNLDAVIALTDRVVVLDADGRTFASGTVDQVLRARADELHEMGVWLPVSTIAALRLQRAGWEFARLPLTPAELREALDATADPGAAAPAPPASTSHDVPVATSHEVRASTPHEVRNNARTSDPSADSVRTSRDSPTAHPAAGPGPRTPAIEVQGLTLTRGRTEVLHDVSLRVDAGEFIAVVGANGVGKTSLIQAIAGVIDPPRGAVRVQGLDPARTDLRRLMRHIGFVFQNPEHQFIAPTVFDEIAHGLRLQKLPDDEVTARTHELLRRFGLEGKAGVHPFLLSGGQKRRLSVGTALVAGAPILALDEPTFGQDRARADELLRLLQDLNADGTTILVVSHDMQLVTEYATRTIVLDDGRIAADAPTSDVFADEALLRRAGLRLPPLVTALHGVTRHPHLAAATRLADLPAGTAGEPTPGDAAPGDPALVETTPGETTRGETTRGETKPDETEPGETTPADRAAGQTEAAG
ncbi:energy-coupling factor transporter ATPase [Microbacterium sp. MC2]